MSSSDADFICLQEVDHFEDYYEKLLLGLDYKVCYAQRTERLSDGCLLAWKSSRWTSCYMEKLDFDLLPEGATDMDYLRHNVGIIGLFALSTGEKLLVATAHLFWNPQYEHVKIAQARYYKEKIEKAAELSTLGAVVTGDLNAMPDSQAFKVILETAIGKKTLQSAYGDYKNGAHPDFTNFTKDFKGNLDYILHTLETVEVRPLPSHAECSAEIALPNSQHGSDHLPLVATLRLPANPA